MRYTLFLLIIIGLHCGCNTPAQRLQNTIRASIRNDMLGRNNGFGINIALDTLTILQIIPVTSHTVLKQVLYCKNCQLADAKMEVDRDSAVIAFWVNYSNGIDKYRNGDTIARSEANRERADSEINELMQSANYKKNQVLYAALTKSRDSVNALYSAADSVHTDNYKVYTHISYRHWPLGRWYTRKLSYSLYFFLDKNYTVLCSLKERYIQ